MKRGDTFQHRYWLDENYKPLTCIVTAVRHGVVYWKQSGERKAKLCFNLAQADRYMKPDSLQRRSSGVSAPPGSAAEPTALAQPVLAPAGGADCERAGGASAVHTAPGGAHAGAPGDAAIES